MIDECDPVFLDIMRRTEAAGCVLGAVRRLLAACRLLDETAPFKEWQAALDEYAAALDELRRLMAVIDAPRAEANCGHD
jgi:hypothetical protein